MYYRHELEANRAAAKLMAKGRIVSVVFVAGLYRLYIFY